MEKNIEKILQDIYEIDASLREKESSLIKIIEELLLAKPSNKVDEDFVRNLRIKLMEEKRTAERGNVFGAPFFKKAALSFGAFAVLAIAGFLVFQQTQTDEGATQKSGVLAIKDAGDGAFGEILFSAQDEQTSENDANSLDYAAESQSSQKTVATAPSEIDGRGAGGGSSAGISLPYEAAFYEYVYAGEDFAVDAGKNKVYRKAQGASAGSELANLMSRMDFKLADLNKFQNTKVNTVEISEDREFGYSLYIDFKRNTFSINMNWEKWPNRDNRPQQNLSNERIISIADKFLSDYALNMQGYGPGEIYEPRMIALARKEAELAQTSFIYPAYSESVQVVYPLEIEGQTVYNQSGEKYGLVVTVDLRFARVSGAYNIYQIGLESSKYSLETDTEKIIKLAKEMGNYYYYSYPESAKKIEVKFGTPKQGLAVIWSNDGELFVPALIFPVTSNSDYYRSNVVVPLVGQMVPKGGEVIPMPARDL